jgi:hypothetical protein
LGINLKNYHQNKDKKGINMWSCAKCNKTTAEGMFWDVTETHQELYKKHLCPTCYAKTKKENQQTLHPINPRMPQEQKEHLETELAWCKVRLKKLSTAYAECRISETTFITTAKKIEEQLVALETIKANGTIAVPTSQECNDSYIFDGAPYVSNVGIEQRLARLERPSGWWYLLPVLFSFLGGLLGYALVRDDDVDMARDLAVTGFVFTFVQFFVIWFILFS